MPKFKATQMVHYEEHFEFEAKDQDEARAMIRSGTVTPEDSTSFEEDGSIDFEEVDDEERSAEGEPVEVGSTDGQHTYCFGCLSEDTSGVLYKKFDPHTVTPIFDDEPRAITLVCQQCQQPFVTIEEAHA